MTIEEVKGAPRSPSVTRSLLPSPDPGAATPADTAKVVVWGLLFYAGSQLAGAMLTQFATAAAAVQAALAEWGGGRVGVNWSDPKGPTPAWRDLARRALGGAALGLGAGALVVGFVLATRGASLAPNRPLFVQLLIGLLVATLGAVRDELFLRGFVLRAVSGAPPLIALAACAAAGAAARFGTWHGAPGAAVAVPMTGAALQAVAFGALWLRDRGAWKACGAHAAWVWATGSLMRGGLLDLRVALGGWGGGDAGIEGGLAATLALAALAALAAFWATRNPRNPAPKGDVSGTAS
jgi:CAAX prenyl protease-like protein